MDTVLHYCPRREEGALTPGPDSWTLRNGVPCCSFCGSIHPDAFMQLAAEGQELGVTSKSYKVYVLVGSRKFYFQHLNLEQRQHFVDLVNAGTVRTDYPWQPLPFFMRRQQ